MIGLVKALLFIIVAAGVTWCSFTVELGDRTFADHVKRIWGTDETQELVQGVEEKAGPAIEKIKRGVEAGMKEINKAPDAGAGADPAPATPSLQATPPTSVTTGTQTSPPTASPSAKPPAR